MFHGVGTVTIVGGNFTTIVLGKCFFVVRPVLLDNLRAVPSSNLETANPTRGGADDTTAASRTWTTDGTRMGVAK